MIRWGTPRGDKTFNPLDPVIKRHVLASQIVVCRSNKDSDQPQKFIFRKFGGRTLEDSIARPIKTGHPSLGPASHFQGIKPERHDLRLIEPPFQSEGIAGLTYLTDSRTKPFKGQSF